MNKFILIALCTLTIDLYAAELGQDELVLIFDVASESYVSKLTFKEITTGELVTHLASSKRQPLLTIKSGEYYLESLEVIDDLFGTKKIDLQNVLNTRFKTIPGTVTYLGVWNIFIEKEYYQHDNEVYLNPHLKAKIYRTFSDEVLAVNARAHPHITSLPLVVATEKNELFSYDWANVTGKE